MGNKGDSDMLVESLEASLRPLSRSSKPPWPTPSSPRTPSPGAPSASPSTSPTGTPAATSSWTPSSTRPSRSSSLTRASTWRPSSCTSPSSVLSSSCFFSSFKLSQGANRRRLVPDGPPWRPARTRTMVWTTSGSPSLLSALPAQEKPPRSSASPSVALVLTQSNSPVTPEELQHRPDPYLQSLCQHGHNITFSQPNNQTKPHPRKSFSAEDSTSSDPRGGHLNMIFSPFSD